jgi:tRNA 2-thiouridine synthesizing protein A
MATRETQLSDSGHYLDVKGLLCPLPVLKARKRMQALAPGDVLTVEATDPASIIDFPHYCNESGHELIEQSSADDVFTFKIRHK